MLTWSSLFEFSAISNYAFVQLADFLFFFTRSILEWLIICSSSATRSVAILLFWFRISSSSFDYECKRRIKWTQMSDFSRMFLITSFLGSNERRVKWMTSYLMNQYFIAIFKVNISFISSFNIKMNREGTASTLGDNWTIFQTHLTFEQWFRTFWFIRPMTFQRGKLNSFPMMAALFFCFSFCLIYF